MSHLFRGVIAYPPTPFDEAGDIQPQTLSQLVAQLADSGVDGVALLGSSGSGMYLTRDDKRALVRHGMAARGGMPLYVVVSALTTRETIECAHEAADAGADGVLVAPVAYVPLTDDEVMGHVAAVANAVQLPVCFYNNPTTTRYDITVAVLQRLAADGALAGLKDTAPDARGWAERLAGYRSAGVAIPVGLSRDALMLAARSAGDAWHSGVAAVLPGAYVGLRAALVAGDEVTVARRTRFLQPIVDELGRCRPLSGLHALAVAAGVPVGAPRRPLPPAGDAVVERFPRASGNRPARVTWDQRYPTERLIAPDDTWLSRYASVVDGLLAALGDGWDVEHVGSTSVPGLVAKPVIDVALRLPDGAALDDARAPLARAGWTTPIVVGDHWATLQVRDGVRFAIGHIFTAGQWPEAHVRLFAAWLRSHPADRDAYSRLKQDLVSQGVWGSDYTAAKAELVLAIVNRARAAQGLGATSKPL